MPIKEQMKRCAGSFNCRLRSVLLLTTLFIVIAVAGILLFAPQ